MKTVFFDSNGRLRNGWWMLVFVACIAATRLVYGPAKGGLKELGVAPEALEVVPFLLTLAATWACTRLRREPLASVGFRLDRRWWRELGAGAGLGVLTVLAVAGLMAAAGGMRFELDPARTAGTLALGAWVMACVALFEENLFRGFLFQRLVAGAGARVALVAFAALFALAHWDNPGMTGAVKAWATVEIALGAVLLGLAYVRTRSLALPVGLHFGWNVALGPLLGFGVSGFGQAGWFRPVAGGGPEWLTGGAFGPEASACAVLVDVVAIVLLWRWRGTAGVPAPADATAPRGREPLPAT